MTVPPNTLEGHANVLLPVASWRRMNTITPLNPIRVDKATFPVRVISNTLAVVPLNVGVEAYATVAYPTPGSVAVPVTVTF